MDEFYSTDKDNIAWTLKQPWVEAITKYMTVGKLILLSKHQFYHLCMKITVGAS